MTGPHTKEPDGIFTGYGGVKATRSGQVTMGVDPLDLEYLDLLPAALNYSIVGLLAVALSHFLSVNMKGDMAQVLGCGTGMQKVSAPYAPLGTMPLQSCPRLIMDFTDKSTNLTQHKRPRT